MPRLDVEAVGQLLSLGEIGDADEGVVALFEFDAGLAQLVRQPVMAVEIELEPARAQVGARG